MFPCYCHHALGIFHSLHLQWLLRKPMSPSGSVRKEIRLGGSLIQIALQLPSSRAQEGVQGTSLEDYWIISQAFSENPTCLSDVWSRLPSSVLHSYRIEHSLTKITQYVKIICPQNRHSMQSLEINMYKLLQLRYPLCLSANLKRCHLPSLILMPSS